MSLLADPQVSEVVAAPGNAGIAQVVRTEAVDVNDAAAIATLAAGYDLVVVGPEAPLVAGAVDACRAAGILAFGPTAAAARLEGSKDFAKEVMRSAGIPTADARTVTDAADLVRELTGRWSGRGQGRGGDRGTGAGAAAR